MRQQLQRSQPFPSLLTFRKLRRTPQYPGSHVNHLTVSHTHYTVLTLLTISNTRISSGGLEMLFSNQKRHSLNIPVTDANNKPVTIAFLIDHLTKNLMTDPRSELFVLDKHMYATLPNYPINISL